MPLAAHTRSNRSVEGSPFPPVGSIKHPPETVAITFYPFHDALATPANPAEHFGLDFPMKNERELRGMFFDLDDFRF